MKFIPDFKAEAALMVDAILGVKVARHDGVELVANALGAAYARGGIAACDMVKAELLERRAS